MEMKAPNPLNQMKGKSQQKKIGWIHSIFEQTRPKARSGLHECATFDQDHLEIHNY
jgi:hypothetical protein